jgi:hypothetical protein
VDEYPSLPFDLSIISYEFPTAKQPPPHHCASEQLNKKTNRSDEMKNVRSLITVLFVSALLAGSTFATTWAPQDFICPIDGQKNTFQVIMSYGSYIYSWPEKYQWLFWPNTEGNTFYSCKKCHLTTYMWDFDKLPKDKLAELKRVLAGVKVSREFKEYNELPITERLEIMEKVYAVLGKDEDWWENLYRLKGYHYGKAGDTARASENRQRSLAIIKKELADARSPVPKKLLLYISASMRHFLGDDAAAITDLETALKTRYANKTETAEEVADGDKGLNERINDYIKQIKSEKNKPRLFDKYRSDVD